jgi:AcrR family transcriptional regulator
MQAPEGTRLQILEAAFETLRNEGFTGATSRAVAARGGFNPALIFYYFGSMDALLLATVDWTSERRLEAYRAALEDATSVEQLFAAATRLYREDRDSGHIDVVSQMIAGSIARSELAPEMVVRMQPWLKLCEETLDRVLAGSPQAAVIPTRELAHAVVTFYLGANLLTHLDPDRARTDAVFARLESLAPFLMLSLGDTRQ